MRNCVLVFLLVHLFKQITITGGFTKPCNESLQTVTFVAKCPPDLSSYEIAATKKNCSSLAAVAQNCTSFLYHCVLSDDKNKFVEVCAPSIYIIGNVCAMFSSKQKSIIRIDDRTCKECPYGYNSTNAFAYQECFTDSSQFSTTGRPLRTTTDNEKTHDDTTTRDDEKTHDDINKNDRTVMFIIVPIAVFVAAVTGIAGVFIFQRKTGKIWFAGLFAEKRQKREDEHELRSLQDDGMQATAKIEVTTDKEIEKMFLEVQIKFLLTALKYPSKSWTVNKLIKITEDINNKIMDSGRKDVLKKLLTEVNNDSDVVKTLTRCGKKMYDVIKSMEKKYNAMEMKITEGSICLTFCFATEHYLENYLNLLRNKEIGLIEDISNVILNKELMDIFHIDSTYVRWTLSKVTVNKGKLYVKEEQFPLPIIGFAESVSKTKGIDVSAVEHPGKTAKPRKYDRHLYPILDLDVQAGGF